MRAARCENTANRTAGLTTAAVALASASIRTVLTRTTTGTTGGTG